MKKRLMTLAALLLAAAMILTASAALAAGNATIAVQGQNGFDDYIQSMFVWDGRLLMTSWNKMYTWSPDSRELVEVKGYDDLQSQLYENAEQDESGGYSSITVGDETIELGVDENLWFDSQILVMGDKLYRIASVSGEEGVSRVMLLELRIAEDGTPSLGGVIDMGDELIWDYGDGYYGSRSLQNPCYYDGKLYALSYGENGRELLAVDSEEQTVDSLTLDLDDNVMSISPFVEGKLLMITADYTGETVETKLYVYDIDGEELTELGDMPRDGYNTPSGIVYDEERGKLYYSMSGSVWRMDLTEEGLGEPEEFGDMPLDAYDDMGAVLLDGMYILSSYSGVVGRDVELDKLPEQKLRVINNGYVQPLKNAYFPFTDKHPEYMVSVSYGSGADDIMQDMMNRSADVDIYSMDVSDSAFFSLLERGFMAELSGSDTIKGAVEAMYPVIRDSVTKDGEIYALPLEMYTGTITFNKQLLIDKFGYTEDDIPTNWVQLLGLIAELAQGKMEDVPEASLFSPGYTKSSAKSEVFYNMLQNYFLWLDSDEANLTRGGEVLLELCAAYEQIDWDGFGIPEEYEDGTAWTYDPQNILMEQSSFSLGYYGEEYLEPLPLAIVEGEKQMLGIRQTVAFVNPFSEHKEAAIEYLEDTLALIEQSMLMSMTPDMNEPIESPYYEESLKYYDERIASLEKSLEETEDEEARDIITENLEEAKAWRDEYEENWRWEVSAESLEKFRAFGEMFTICHTSIWGSDSTTQVAQYLSGAISAQQLVSELEKTLQMQRLEGM